MALTFLVGDMVGPHNEEHIEWKISDYISQSQKADTCFESPSFYCLGTKWCIHFYPNGERSEENVGMINIYLKVQSSIPCYPITFSLGIKDIPYYLQKDPLTITFTFSEHNTFVGWLDVISRNDLIRTMKEDPTRTSLTVYCNIRTNLPSVKDVACQSLADILERGSNKFLEILSKDLSNLYENKTDPDCVLRVNETKFPVHRSVLSSRSTVFAAMFHHDTSESQSGEVDILDVDAGALGNVLYYIYSGKVCGLCPETAVSMYVVSDKYALIELREECLNFLTNNLTMENICDAALLAHTHAETNLENYVLQFIEERLEELMKNDNWKKFSDNHFKLANYLLCSAFMATKVKLMKISSIA